MWTRIASMYTHLNLVFVLLFRWLPETLQDIVRASTLLILVVVSSIWLSGDLLVTYREFVDSFGMSSLPPKFLWGLAVAGDVLLHVVPLLLIGLPRQKSSMLIAFGILSVWYACNRHRIHEIYIPRIQGTKADRGVIMAGLAAFGMQ